MVLQRTLLELLLVLASSLPRIGCVRGSHRYVASKSEEQTVTIQVSSIGRCPTKPSDDNENCLNTTEPAQDNIVNITTRHPEILLANIAYNCTSMDTSGTEESEDDCVINGSSIDTRPQKVEGNIRCKRAAWEALMDEWCAVDSKIALAVTEAMDYERDKLKIENISPGCESLKITTAKEQKNIAANGTITLNDSLVACEPVISPKPLALEPQREEEECQILLKAEDGHTIALYICKHTPKPEEKEGKNCPADEDGKDCGSDPRQPSPNPSKEQTVTPDMSAELPLPDLGQAPSLVDLSHKKTCTIDKLPPEANLRCGASSSGTIEIGGDSLTVDNSGVTCAKEGTEGEETIGKCRINVTAIAGSEGTHEAGIYYCPRHGLKGPHDSWCTSVPHSEEPVLQPNDVMRPCEITQNENNNPNVCRIEAAKGQVNIRPSRYENLKDKLNAESYCMLWEDGKVQGVYHKCLISIGDGKGKTQSFLCEDDKRGQLEKEISAFCKKTEGNVGRPKGGSEGGQDSKDDHRGERGASRGKETPESVASGDEDNDNEEFPEGAASNGDDANNSNVSHLEDKAIVTEKTPSASPNRTVKANTTSIIKRHIKGSGTRGTQILVFIVFSVFIAITLSP